MLRDPALAVIPIGDTARSTSAGAPYSSPSFWRWATLPSSSAITSGRPSRAPLIYRLIKHLASHVDCCLIRTLRSQGMEEKCARLSSTTPSCIA